MLLLKKYKWRLTGSAFFLGTTSVVIYLTLDWSKVNKAVEMGFSALRHLSSWMIILALLGLSQCYLNFRNRITTYINKNSFSIYFVHQTILIVIGYYTVRVISTTVVQMFVIMFGTFLSSIVACEVLKRIPVVRTMFGMANK